MGSSIGTNLVFIDYWILGRLENGDEIEILDFNNLILKKEKKYNIYKIENSLKLLILNQ